MTSLTASEKNACYELQVHVQNMRTYES
jgi:hypothetical protein